MTPTVLLSKLVLFNLGPALVLLHLIFFVIVIWTITHSSSQLFLAKYGRRHRIFGGLLLSWLLLGVLLQTSRSPIFPPLLYDIILGVLGLTATLTAAYDFKDAHMRVKNVASGTLEEKATVTFDEMIEHAFYQGLNLAQILFFHAISKFDFAGRVGLLMLVTAPWLIRHQFPVNPFSDNWLNHDPGFIVSLLYRTKKSQYLLYKHFLLHGLNLSVVLTPSLDLPSHPWFRLFWVSLNTSYVMEFFLQSLVKKNHLSQERLVGLQLLLISASTATALPVLAQLYWPAPLLSLGLNLVHRRHDFLNTMVVLAICSSLKFLL